MLARVWLKRTGKGAPMDLRPDVNEEIALLRSRAPEITGALVCTVDGMLVTTDLADDAEQTAALTAALLALGRRMAGVARIGAYEETLISGAHGHTACYAAGPTLVLTVLAGQGANLGLLRIEGRKTAAALAAIAERAHAHRRTANRE